MKPKPHSDVEDELFQSRLDQIISPDHELVKLASRVDWEALAEKFGEKYYAKKGAPGIPTRVMVGLHYLKYTFSQSDENVVAHFVENPYWQYFCGYEYFQHEPPIHPSSMTRWRQRIGEEGAEELLKETIRLAFQCRVLRAPDLLKVIADTTVQEKDITFPTDPKLRLRALRALVRQAQEDGIKLRQSYVRVGKKAMCEYSRFRIAKKFKLAQKRNRKLRTYLGRVLRDIERKRPHPSPAMKKLLGVSWRIYLQQRTDKNKVYSVHQPHVECISKGKAHKKYEFGCKASYVTTSHSNFIVSAQALHGNPFDGHTLKSVIETVEKLTGVKCKEIFCDRGYRGVRKKDLPHCEVHLEGKGFKGLSRTEKKWLKRRAAIEPIIGHLKSDHRLGRNFLQGVGGDKVNAIMAAVGFNFKKLLNFFWPNLFTLCERSGGLTERFRDVFQSVFAILKTGFRVATG